MVTEFGLGGTKLEIWGSMLRNFTGDSPFSEQPIIFILCIVLIFLSQSYVHILGVPCQVLVFFFASFRHLFHFF